MPYADPDQARAYRKQWYARNREAVRARQRDGYGEREAARARERALAWQKANPGRRKEITKRHRAKAYAEDPEKFRERSREFLRLHPEKRAERQAWRRAARVRATPPWADRAVLKAIYRRAAEAGLTVDHIDPLQHPLVCGLHVPWNLQMMTGQANASKGNRFEPYSINP